MLFTEEQKQFMRYVAEETAQIVSNECKENITKAKEEIIESMTTFTNTQIEIRKYKCNEELEDTRNEIKGIKRFRKTFNTISIGTAITVCGKIIYDYFRK